MLNNTTAGHALAQQTQQEFNPEYLLAYVNGNSDPENVARDLDRAMHLFFQYFCTPGSHCPNMADSNTFFALREMRNAIIKGYNGLDLD